MRHILFGLFLFAVIGCGSGGSSGDANNSLGVVGEYAEVYNTTTGDAKAIGLKLDGSNYEMKYYFFPSKNFGVGHYVIEKGTYNVSGDNYTGAVTYITCQSDSSSGTDVITIKNNGDGTISVTVGNTTLILKNMNLQQKLKEFGMVAEQEDTDCNTVP